MAADEKYRIFRNLFFNELGITKEDIREWVKEACREEAERLVNNSYDSFNVESFIEDALGRKGIWDRGKLTEDLRKEIARQVIDNLNIDVNVSVKDGINK